MPVHLDTDTDNIDPSPSREKVCFLGLTSQIICMCCCRILVPPGPDVDTWSLSPSLASQMKQMGKDVGRVKKRKFVHTDLHYCCAGKMFWLCFWFLNCLKDLHLLLLQLLFLFQEHNELRPCLLWAEIFICSTCQPSWQPGITEETVYLLNPISVVKMLFDFVCLSKLIELLYEFSFLSIVIVVSVSLDFVRDSMLDVWASLFVSISFASP